MERSVSLAGCSVISLPFFCVSCIFYIFFSQIWWILPKQAKWQTDKVTAENPQVAVVNMELPSVAPWWGKKKQMAQTDSVYSAALFVNPSFPSTGQSSITNLQTSPPATPSLSFQVFLSIRGYCHCFFLSLHLDTLQSARLFNYLPHYLFMLIFFILCLYQPVSPSLFLLLSIIYSNPIACSCRSDSSELQGWLQWDKLYAVTGRRREGAWSAGREGQMS